MVKKKHHAHKIYIFEILESHLDSKMLILWEGCGIWDQGNKQTCCPCSISEEVLFPERSVQPSALNASILYLHCTDLGPLGKLV